MIIIIPTATKADLRKHLKAKDLEFVTLFCKPLLPSSEWLLIQKLGRSLLEHRETPQRCDHLAIETSCTIHRCTELTIAHHSQRS
jgi:hypothetical protein